MNGISLYAKDGNIYAVFADPVLVDSVDAADIEDVKAQLLHNIGTMFDKYVIGEAVKGIFDKPETEPDGVALDMVFGFVGGEKTGEADGKPKRRGGRKKSLKTVLSEGTSNNGLTGNSYPVVPEDDEKDSVFSESAFLGDEDKSICIKPDETIFESAASERTELSLEDNLGAVTAESANDDSAETVDKGLPAMDEFMSDSTSEERTEVPLEETLGALTDDVSDGRAGGGEPMVSKDEPKESAEEADSHEDESVAKQMAETLASEEEPSVKPEVKAKPKAVLKEESEPEEKDGSAPKRKIDIGKILALRKAKWSVKDIAGDMGLEPHQVSQALWRHKRMMEEKNGSEQSAQGESQ